MILSVSRRTDIPAYYSDWFYNRIKEGFVLVRNPFNPGQLSRINLSPDVVDCIVFWTKNPAPMLERLEELKDYNYYFQFTLTGYGRDVETNLPDKREVLLPTFQKLAEVIGPERVVWRYDPILFSERYTPEYHLKAFSKIAEALNGYTKRCVVSFLDMYPKIKKNMDSLGVVMPLEWAYEPMTNGTSGMGKAAQEFTLQDFAGELAKIARKNNMDIFSCAEKIELKNCGISHSSCIDKALVEEVIGCRIDVKKDKNQRSECGCVESIEVGTYNTCRNGCKYCYANHSPVSVEKNYAAYDPVSPILCGKITREDKVTERVVKSLKVAQRSLFDNE